MTRFFCTYFRATKSKQRLVPIQCGLCLPRPGGKDKTMKFHKTGNKNRQTYTYLGLDGRKETLVPGENGITEEFILALHRMDDNEVYNNNKNRKAPVQEWEKPIIEDWKRWHPGEELPERTTLSLDEIIYPSNESGDSDKSVLLADPSQSIDKDVPAGVERLREVVELLTAEQRELYRMVVLEGMSQEDAGKEMGISEGAVQKRMVRIRESIKRLF